MKKEFASVLLVLMLVSSAVIAGGGDAEQGSYYETHKSFLSMNCIDEQTQKDMDDCGVNSLAGVKKEMEAVLEALSASKPSIAKEIQLDQQNWAAYAKSSCDIETHDSKEGSGYFSVLNYCMETKINERISYLMWLVDTP